MSHNLKTDLSFIEILIFGDICSVLAYEVKNRNHMKLCFKWKSAKPRKPPWTEGRNQLSLLQNILMYCS